MTTVKNSLKIVREMQQRIEESRGIVVSSMAKECQDLALRCDCTSLSYILALPQCYTEARRAILALRTWVTEDTQYLNFIQTYVFICESVRMRWLQIACGYAHF
jgi:RNase P/RNase MRP subunit p30